jgi:hypothetical protein
MATAGGAEGAGAGTREKHPATSNTSKLPKPLARRSVRENEERGFIRGKSEWPAGREYDAAEGK